MPTRAPTGTASAEGILGFLRELSGYLILRNHDVLANLERGGDLDLLVQQPASVEKSLITFFGPPTRIAKRSYVWGYSYTWGHVDLLPSLSWRGAIYLSNSSAFSKAQWSASQLPRPSLAHEALVSWFSSLLFGGFFPGRYRNVILQAAKEDELAFEEALAAAAGKRWGRRLIQAARDGCPEVSARWVRPLRTAVWTRALIRDPAGTLARFTDFLKAEFRLRIAPPTPWVAVLGPDGSGKSSVLAELRARLSAARVLKGVRLYHWRPSFLPQVARNVGRADRPHADPPRGAVESVAKLAFLLADWWAGYWSQIVHLRTKGCLVLFDRYYLDLLVDPKRYRYGGPAFLTRWVGRLVPQPDLVFVLDASPSVLWARKQEVLISEAARQRSAYLALARRIPRCRVVNASRSLREVVDEIERTLVTFMHGQAERKLGL